eukprot:69627-Amphidinium_carterae.1
MTEVRVHLVQRSAGLGLKLPLWRLVSPDGPPHEPIAFIQNRSVAVMYSVQICKRSTALTVDPCTWRENCALFADMTPAAFNLKRSVSSSIPVYIFKPTRDDGSTNGPASHPMQITEA